MRVLVTGSSGYLGRHAVQTALNRGHEVVGIDTRKSGVAHRRFMEKPGDITDRMFVLDAASDCEVILHLAAALAQFEPDEKRMHSVNVGGTANTLAAAARHEVKKYIFMSSVEVYGVDVPKPCPEDAPLNPICQYGADKVESEDLCREYLEKGVDVTIFRPPTINGPGQNEPFLVSQMEAVSRGKATLLPGGGRTKLQMVDVRDVCEAMFMAVDHPKSRGQIMNLGSDDVPTLRRVAQALYEHAGVKPKLVNVNARLARAAVRVLSPLHMSPVEPQHLEIALRDYTFDNTKAKEVLGWKPSKDDIESFNDAYDWHVKHR